MTSMFNLFLVLFSLKSVLLVYNLHNMKLLSIDEETADGELFVVYNGSDIGEAEGTCGWHYY